MCARERASARARVCLETCACECIFNPEGYDRIHDRGRLSRAGSPETWEGHTTTLVMSHPIFVNVFIIAVISTDMATWCRMENTSAFFFFFFTLRRSLFDTYNTLSFSHHIMSTLQLFCYRLVVWWHTFGMGGAGWWG